jgi:aryl-alcohol dehydrogenase-like predicted oxidoreductase
LNPSAGREVSVEFGEVNYGNVIGECARQSMGVFAIRVFAGGALTGQPPSPHTLTTKFFPLDLYERDQGRAAELEKQVPAGHSLPELALRFAVSHPAVTSALVGFSCPEQVDEVVRFSAAGPLCPELLESLATPDVRCPANPEPGADRCPPSAALPGTMIREALRRPGGT